jgi:hypothetical protein
VSERVELTALALIVTIVGVLAGRASFSHVVQWSMDNLPDGTPQSYGYTNATISELLPISVLLFMRSRRRRGDTPGVLAWSMLISAGLFSLTAQFAVAVPSLSGWVVAAVPTLAFTALTKLLLSMNPAISASPVVENPPALPAEAAIDGGPLSGRDEVGLPSSAPKDPADIPVVKAARPKRAAASSGAGASPPVQRVRPRSLTSAAKVGSAVTELGPDATPTQVAAKVGVSESTARRHMPKPVTSPSPRRPADTASDDSSSSRLVGAGAR